MQTRVRPLQTLLQLLLPLLLDPLRDGGAQSVDVGLVLDNLGEDVMTLRSPVVASLDCVLRIGGILRYESAGPNPNATLRTDPRRRRRVALTCLIMGSSIALCSSSSFFKLSMYTCNASSWASSSNGEGILAGMGGLQSLMCIRSAGASVRRPYVPPSLLMLDLPDRTLALSSWSWSRS
jgi:hypothetical protein